MKLNLDLEGIKTILEIRNYRPSNKDNWDDEWCKVTFSLTANDWLNYGKLEDELLLCCEVEELRDKLKNLLLDEISENTEVSFIEPDFTFILSPKQIDSQLTVFSEHPSVIDIDAKWQISFWHDGLTANFLTVCLDREEIEYLKNYLNLITGTMDKSNTSIQDMLNRNIIIE